LKTDYHGNPYDHYEKIGRGASVPYRYRHVPNAAISGHNIRPLSKVSVQDCMAACDREYWCKSFDYHKGKNRCDLSNKNAFDVGGLKTDYHGNPYDHYEKIGKEPSVSYGYRHVPNAALSGHNTKHLSNVSAQDCMTACDREHWCKSFDYYKGKNRCDLSNKNAYDVGGLKTDYPGDPYDHYEKRSR
jgi:hypothetical protein